MNLIDTNLNLISAAYGLVQGTDVNVEIGVDPHGNVSANGRINYNPNPSVNIYTNVTVPVGGGAPGGNAGIIFKFP